MNPYITENEEGEHTMVEESKPVLVERVKVTKKRRYYGMDDYNAWQLGQDLFEKYHGY
jgi:hypothetical protein